ncbi:MAG TPA: diguanylate cyclase [Bacillota bacterium]|jgi:diguanylate cyclase (GGDEF)-like protein
MKQRAPRVLAVTAGPETDDLCLRLSGLGYEVISTTGEDPVATAHRAAPDVIVIQGPGADGVIVALARDDEAWLIPVVVIDGRDEPPAMPVRLRDVQLCDFLAPPYEPRELAACIRSATRAKRLRDEFRRRERILRQLVIRDDLTGLFTRAYARERAKQEVARGKRYGYAVSCLRLDIDELARVNQQYGRGAGDQVLCQVATLLTRMTREADVVCRYHGDRFMALLPQTDRAGLEVLAERVRLAVERYRDPSGPRVTATIGGATFPGPEVQGSGSLVRRAGDALRLGRQGGGNKIVIL